MKPGGYFRVLEYVEPGSFFLNLIYFLFFLVEIAGMEESLFILKFSIPITDSSFDSEGFKCPELVAAAVMNKSNTHPTLVVSPDVPKDIHP
jgi:hypothetical protein